jgi:pilus assembly protein CpaE
MTILWDNDPAAAEVYQFAVSDRIQIVKVGHLVARALVENPAELLVIVGPDVELQAASSEGRDPR